MNENYNEPTSSETKFLTKLILGKKNIELGN